MDWDTADGTADAGDWPGPGPGRSPSRQAARPVRQRHGSNADALVEGMETLVGDVVRQRRRPGRRRGHGRAGAGPAGGTDFNADGRKRTGWSASPRELGRSPLWFMDWAAIRLSGIFAEPVRAAGHQLEDRGHLATSTATASRTSSGGTRCLGQNVVWYMDGADRLSRDLMTRPPWPIRTGRSSGTGDFNVDGKADILWRHGCPARTWSGS